MLIIDAGTGISLHCPDSVTGWDSIEKGQLITKVAEAKAPEAEGCKLTGELLTCKPGKLEELKGVHLPWTSEMFETEGKYLANIVGTGGHPGWAFQCAGVIDTCTEATEKTGFSEFLSGVTNKVLLVLSRLENKTKMNCSLGGSERGEVKGLFAILLWNGNGLSLTTL